MIRKFKLFAVMAVAALALTAVAASAAQAAPEFHVESAPATITGEQIGVQEFTTTAGTVKCTTATFKGSTAVTTTTTQLLAPTYSGCTGFFGFVASTVTMNGCEYNFHLTSGGVSPFPATADIVCPAGKEITVESNFTNCVIHVPAQTGLSGITITNTGTKTTRDLDVKLAIKNITYSQLGSECFNGEWTDHTGGTLNGEATVKADVGTSSTQQGLWVA